MLHLLHEIFKNHRKIKIETKFKVDNISLNHNL